jgi:signal transduction histidine kinase
VQSNTSMLTDTLNVDQDLRDHAASVQIAGRWLLAARILWMSLAVMTVTLLLVAIPLRYEQYTEICSSKPCDFQLSADEADAIQDIGISRSGFALYAIALEVTTSLTFVGVGLFIFWRQSQEWIALLVSLWLITFGTADVLLALKDHHLLLKYITDYLDVIGWVILLPLFLFLFPDGRFVPRWTRWILIAGAGVMFLQTVLQPDQIDPANPTSLRGQIMWFSIQIAGIGTQVYRYFRVSDPVQRQQTRWVVYGLGMAVLLISLVIALGQTGLPISEPGHADLVYKLFELTLVKLAFVIIPLTIGISILRYRLWDIDIIISRTLVFGSLTLAVVGIYVLIVGSLGALFQSSGNLFFSLLATGAVAVLFQPIRERLQRTVNQMMFGERDDPVAVLSRMGQQMQAITAPEAMLQGIVETIAQALKLPYSAIEVRAGHDFKVAAACGETASEIVRFPLVYQGETIGQLAVGQRAPGEAIAASDRTLLSTVASQAAAAVHMAWLTTDLQRSRERLVTTREEERRRLRRDLHDGLGPALATLSLQAEAARDLMRANPDRSEALMDEVVAGTQEAIVNIRQVVYGLRPPALDDLGLISALQEQAAQYRGHVRIMLDVPEQLPTLPAAVEVAIYRIVQEALTNVVRHARATTCTVSLTITDHVALRIADDGQGISTANRAGVGLNSMHERAAELGGECRIESGQAIGTNIFINLPIRLGARNGQG